MKIDARGMKFVYAVGATIAGTTDNYSAGIDTKGYDGAIVLLQASLAAASAELDTTVQEAGTNAGASFAHIAGCSFTQVTPTAATLAAQAGFIDLRKRKRYIRVRCKGDGTNLVGYSATVILVSPKYLPAVASATIKFSI